jgi:hypothetical protein
MRWAPVLLLASVCVVGAAAYLKTGEEPYICVDETAIDGFSISDEAKGLCKGFCDRWARIQPPSVRACVRSCVRSCVLPHDDIRQ